MPPEENQGSAVDTAAPAGAPASNNAQPADAGSKSGDEPLVNYREVVELRKETRENSRLLKELLERGSAPATQPKKDAAPGDTGAQALAKLEALEARNAFRECLDGLDLEVSAEQRRDLLELYEAKRGTISDTQEWVTARVKAWGLKKRGAAPAATASKETPAPSVTNTGAPTRDPATALGKGLFDLPPGAARGMSRDELRARRQYELSQGGGGNPWRK
jgi:hypothetical protein